VVVPQLEPASCLGADCPKAAAHRLTHRLQRFRVAPLAASIPKISGRMVIDGEHDAYPAIGRNFG
jgi:hypothetical protein